MASSIAFLLALVVCTFAGFLIGITVGRADAERNAPLIGSLDFNLADPEKEFLSLHITEDIDIHKPPLNVLLKVNVLEHTND